MRARDASAITCDREFTGPSSWGYGSVVEAQHGVKPGCRLGWWIRWRSYGLTRRRETSLDEHKFWQGLIRTRTLRSHNPHPSRDGSLRTDRRLLPCAGAAGREVHTSHDVDGDASAPSLANILVEHYVDNWVRFERFGVMPLERIIGNRIRGVSVRRTHVSPGNPRTRAGDHRAQSEAPQVVEKSRDRAFKARPRSGLKLFLRGSPHLGTRALPAILLISSCPLLLRQIPCPGISNSGQVRSSFQPGAVGTTKKLLSNGPEISWRKRVRMTRCISALA